MPLDPTTIGRYKVLGTLGQGAMGLVYLGEDPLLKRGVAIKVVQAGGFRQEEALRRFKKEAEISAQLNHPNLITIFDVGEDPAVGPYLTMEYVDGEGLDATLARGPLAPAVALDLLIQAMEALEAAHAAGIVHRDIKPGNMLVGKDGRLRLTDFGIARQEDGQQTSTAGFLGSPAYAAPELLRSEPASEASDRWAFAVTAYQCFTGLMPFKGEHVSDLLFAIAHGDPTLSETLPAPLAVVFSKAMARAPEARHANLRAFLSDLLDASGLTPEDHDRLALRLGRTRPVARAVTDPPGWLQQYRGWILAAGAGILLLAAWLVFQQSPGRVLTLESEPPGAEVQVDGKALGRTPLREVHVPRGASRLRFELAERVPVDYDLKAGDKRVKVRMEPAPWFLDVVTDPSGAEVRLDGDLVGRSPLRNLKVPGEGRHKLRLQAPGYESLTLHLDRHRVLPEPIRLQKGSGEREEAKAPDKDNPVKKFFKGLLG